MFLLLALLIYVQVKGLVNILAGEEKIAVVKFHF